LSTILKALRRLEEQKSAVTPRPLRDEVVLVPARRRSRRGLVVAIAAAFAFALVGGGLVWLFDRAPVEVSEQVAATAPAPDVAAPPAPEPILAAAEERATEVRVSAPESIAGAMQRPIVPVPASPPDFAVVRPGAQEQQERAAAPVEPATAEYDEVVVERRSAVAPMPEVEPGFVDEDIPTARVARSPSPVRVERTQWHPSPERRVAWVEVEGVTALREVREGERVGPYVVRKIEPAAVLFADGSVELRREVGR
jgi:hypothetical protein